MTPSVLPTDYEFIANYNNGMRPVDVYRKGCVEEVSIVTDNGIIKAR
jgi:hypothetical protein